MSAPRYAKLASRALSEQSAEPSPPSQQARSEAILAIEAALARRASRKRAVRAASIGAIAAAAALVIAYGVKTKPVSVASSAPAHRPEAPATVVVRPSGEGARIVGGMPAAGGEEVVSAGARVVALAHGHALLAFATGSKVDVDQGGDVTVVEPGPRQVLALAAGAMKADVVKLRPGERFVVRTSDAEVEVHGTSFRVAQVPADSSCGNGTTTRVDVYEGIVTVRHAGVEDHVGAGDTWPRDCVHAEPPADPSSPAPVRAEAPPSTRSLPQPPARPSAASTSEPPFERAAVAAASTLAEQNELFAAAVASKHRGDSRDAIARFEALLSKYPGGPLSEQATAERMKLLRDVDRSRAIQAARAYLASYPNGFARADAEAIVATER